MQTRTRGRERLSRFTILYARTTGPKKQKRWRSGILTVGFNAATIYDAEAHTSVVCVRGSGLLPNAVYKRMELAHLGADWAAGTELAVGAYTTQVEEVMELHLIPYDEVCSGGDTEQGGGGCGVLHGSMGEAAGSNATAVTPENMTDTCAIGIPVASASQCRAHDGAEDCGKVQGKESGATACRGQKLFHQCLKHSSAVQRVRQVSPCCDQEGCSLNSLVNGSCDPVAPLCVESEAACHGTTSSSSSGKREASGACTALCELPLSSCDERDSTRACFLRKRARRSLDEVLGELHRSYPQYFS